MVQKWIDIDPDIDLMDFYQGDHPKLRLLAVLDLICNNTDRKIGHLIPIAGGHVYGCDHGVTFHSDDKLRTVLWQWAGTPFSASEMKLLTQARELFAVDKVDLITGLIDENEIAATITRIDRALIDGSFPLPSTEWPAVPWPPF
jgi:uncharacterized repeat protein (TIGR03843 family)